MLISCIVIKLMHYLMLLNLLLSTDTWTVSLVFYNNFMKSYIYIYIYYTYNIMYTNINEYIIYVFFYLCIYHLVIDHCNI